MKKIETLLAEARDAEQAGDREAAIAAYLNVYRLAWGHGKAAVALNRLAKQFFVDCIAVRDTGDVEGAIALAVRSLELNPSSDEVQRECKRLVGNRVRRDLTQECMIFPDTERATKFYGDAIQTALDFVVYGGVIGDILEFGVLAGWTARLFAERMRKAQFFGDLHLFDSFVGLPRKKDAIDKQSYDVTRGIWDAEMELPATLIEEIGKPVEEHIVDMLSYVISRDRIHVRKGFFSDTLREPIKAKAAIVHLDCDLYQSTREVLDALARDDILQDGTVLMFDDWNCNRANPAFGQRRALREFLDRHKARYDVSQFFGYGYNCNAFILHDLEVRPSARGSEAAA